uniref:Secreted protein n=1 Tax=Cacopsylla melanoneura TaxID=428564 RepID=A0A8D8UBZ2_9HEMI
MYSLVRIVWSALEMIAFFSGVSIVRVERPHNMVLNVHTIWCETSTQYGVDQYGWVSIDRNSKDRSGLCLGSFVFPKAALCVCLRHKPQMSSKSIESSII